MPQARERQISLMDTAWYHCVSRCVRRAFLAGNDPYSGQSFEHRRQWIVDRLRELSSVFCIDVAAYAVMSNHYHVVLHVDEGEEKSLSDQQVVERWTQLFHSNMLVERYLAGVADDAQSEKARECINEWRSRLRDISWFMRCLNEPIARQANLEDGCKGRFWEGRFKSQALLDEKAVLTCMAYVDLNPIRACMAESVDTSEYTSAFERIHGKSSNEDIAQTDENGFKFKPLMGFAGDERDSQPKGISFNLISYLELLDWTGRVIREDKRGAISSAEPELLGKLGFDEATWLKQARTFGKQKLIAVGSLAELAKFAAHTQHKWMAGRRELTAIYH